jgi:DNA polymerase-3 subunit delta'
MTFSEIPGLNIEKEKILFLIRQGRLPHALLIYGPEGGGKLALSLALCQYLQCEKPGPSDSCGLCSPCQKSRKLVHPDTHFSFPVSGTNVLSDQLLQEWRQAVIENPYLNISMWQEKSEQENKLSNISAAECRNMLKKLSLTIYEGKIRILLVWLPEYLGKEGNMLLKLIEEPPPDSLILLVAENRDLLLPTILSRCQSLGIPAFRDDDVQFMVQQSGIQDAGLARNIVRTAEGNMMEALRMVADQVHPHSEKLVRWLRLCYKGDAAEILSWVESFSVQGRDVHRQFLKFGLRFIGQVLSYKISPEEEETFNEDEWKGIKGLAARLEIGEIQELATLFDEHIYYVERNANPKILFTALSLNLRDVLNHREIKTIHLI